MSYFLQPHLLRGKTEPVLQKGNVDFFYVTTKENLKNVNQISLWSDCYGARSSW